MTTVYVVMGEFEDGGWDRDSVKVFLSKATANSYRRWLFEKTSYSDSCILTLKVID